MAITAQVSMPFTASASGAASGLVGTIGVQVVDDEANVVIARTTADIIELVAGSGVYLWTCAAAPGTVGNYEVIWDNGDGTFASEQLTVAAAPISTSGGSGAPPYPTIGTVRAQAQQAQRAVRGRASVATYTFGLDDDALPDNATTVSVTVINAEGYIVVNDQTATLGSVVSETQQASFDLSPATTPQRDFFTCLWVATIGGVSVTQVSTIDVCDTRLFPLSDYNQYPELAKLSLTTAQLEQARMFAEDRLEWECGCAFTGRYGSEEHLLDDDYRLPTYADVSSAPYGPICTGGRHKLALRQPFVQALRGISQAWIDPDTNTSGTNQLDLDYAQLDTHKSVVHYRDQYGGGLLGDITISYEHGQPTPAVRRICCILARYRLLHGPLDQRATQMAVEGAGGTINLATPGYGGAIFGIPEVDQFVHDHNHRADGFVGASWPS